MKTHELAETLFTDGDWCLMKGPITWFMDQHRYFIHHTCTHRNSEGVLGWQTWFDPELRNGKPWCPKCDSEPPENLIGLFIAMARL